MCGQADGHDGSVRAHVEGGLLEGFFGDGDEEDGVGADFVWGDGFDVADDVFGFGEVDEGLVPANQALFRGHMGKKKGDMRN